MLKGATGNNLKNVTLTIPLGKLIGVTGVSGSGKSSLTFDTIYAEGQRRYMESFSAYARSFIGDMERPDVDKIEGLSPVVYVHTPGSNIWVVQNVPDEFVPGINSKYGWRNCSDHSGKYGFWLSNSYNIIFMVDENFNRLPEYDFLQQFNLINTLSHDNENNIWAGVKV